MISLYENGINGILADEMVRTCNKVIMIQFCSHACNGYFNWLLGVEPLLIQLII